MEILKSNVKGGNINNEHINNQLDIDVSKSKVVEERKRMKR